MNRSEEEGSLWVVDRASRQGDVSESIMTIEKYEFT